MSKATMSALVLILAGCVSSGQTPETPHEFEVVTPAMAAGVTNRLWLIEDLIALLRFTQVYTTGCGRLSIAPPNGRSPYANR